MCSESTLCSVCSVCVLRQEEGGEEEEEETTKKPSTDNKEAIDRQQRGHRQPSSDNRPETATNNHSHECMCVCGCMFVDVFAHIHTSKGEKSKKGVGGSARARFGAPFKGTQRKVAVFLHETQFPLQDVVLKMVA